MPNRYYGWKKQAPDFRDWKFCPERLKALPPSVNLYAMLGPVLDQGQLGSCGPNAVDGLIEFDQAKQGLPVYYNARGGTATDDGVDNRTMLSSLNKYGFCDEALWPYVISQFADKPPDVAYTAAVPNQIKSYATVAQDLTSLKSCLASGFPFLFGFTVYESFETRAVDASGDVPMPSASESVLGGHDVVIYGYDDTRQVFLFRNSWGTSWGNQGDGTFPYAYATDVNLSGDFWVINAVPGGTPVPPPPPPPPVGSPLSLSHDWPVGLCTIHSGRHVINAVLTGQPVKAGKHTVT